ncbi:hypothetical protein CHKEEEPN_3434 [Methylorubrum podarium]|nr:hypothetical protein CHKEEEPN_3434 [Methylorubrum podarium]
MTPPLNVTLVALPLADVLMSFCDIPKPEMWSALTTPSTPAVVESLKSETLSKSFLVGSVAMSRVTRRLLSPGRTIAGVRERLSGPTPPSRTSGPSMRLSSCVWREKVLRSEVTFVASGLLSTLTRTARSKFDASKVIVAGVVAVARVKRGSALSVRVWPSPARVIVTDPRGAVVRTTS